jgi:Kef-type K+ transport system membrane component KefB
VAAGYVVPAVLVGSGQQRGVFAMFIGVAMAVSAIPVIAKTLTDMRLIDHRVGQLTLAVGVLDDAVAWLLLSLVSALATVGLSMPSLSRSVLYLAGFVATALIVGRPLVGRLMRGVTRLGTPAATTAATVVIILSGGAAALALGLEPAFGAFAAGVLIGLPGVTEPRHLTALHAITMSVLAPIFLATAGLRVNLAAFTDPSTILSTAGLLAIAIASKFAGAYAGARASRIPRWEAVAIGAGMNARGVVEIVIATVGLRIGVLTTGSYSIVVVIAIVTSLMAPPLLRTAMRHVDSGRLEDDHADHDGELDPDHVHR